jgi:hypothetical protein
MSLVWFSLEAHAQAQLKAEQRNGLLDEMNKESRDVPFD